jgi:hypothetical protein
MTDMRINPNYSNQAALNNINSKKPSSVSKFSGILKNAVQSAGNTQKSKSLDDIFNEAAEKNNIPVNLLKAVAKVESGFDPNAVSCCGAQGIMQLMPSTAKSMGVNNPLDPEENIMAGARYLSQKIQSYNGDVRLALASYNAGSGNVKKYGGVPPFKQTQEYIKRVMEEAGGDISVPNQQVSTLNSYGNGLGFPTIGNPQQPVSSDFTYNDYLKFLQVYVELMKVNVVNSLSSDISGMSQNNQPMSIL